MKVLSIGQSREPERKGLGTSGARTDVRQPLILPSTATSKKTIAILDFKGGASIPAESSTARKIMELTRRYVCEVHCWDRVNSWRVRSMVDRGNRALQKSRRDRRWLRVRKWHRGTGCPGCPQAGTTKEALGARKTQSRSGLDRRRTLCTDRSLDRGRGEYSRVMTASNTGIEAECLRRKKWELLRDLEGPSLDPEECPQETPGCASGASQMDLSVEEVVPLWILVALCFCCCRSVHAVGIGRSVTLLLGACLKNVSLSFQR